MKKILPIIAIILSICLAISACNDDDSNSVDLADYQEWRDVNDTWVAEMQQRKNPDGTPYYTTVTPAWNPDVYILMHFFNDRSETAQNLVPLYTSTVDVIYKGYNCKGVGFDSSTYVNNYGRLGIYRTQCSNVIQGWSIALENMHVGDSAEIIIPYNVAYGTSYVSTTILPYSSLRFNLRLHDIYRYEGSPY